MDYTKIIAEIGINYAYGTDRSKFLDNAKELIDVAIHAGCNWVKFQKRSPNHCVPEDQKLKEKTVPWRSEPTTYIQYKHDIEFTKEEWIELAEYIDKKDIGWFVSVWDTQSVDFMHDLKHLGGTQILKIPSAKLHDIDLGLYAYAHCEHLMVSTGMSDESEIEKFIQHCNPDIILHTNSTYPSPIDELNLEYIKWLKDKYPNNEIGYSGHEFGLSTTLAAVCLGATWIERHITLDRTYWGSDQMASVEPHGLQKLVKAIRDIESSMGGYGPRKVLKSELSKRKSLRGI